MIYGQSVGSIGKGIIENFHNEENLYTLIYNKRNKSKTIEGHKLYGFYPPVTSGWFINNYFQDIIFRKFKKYAINWEKQGIVHYLNEKIKPFTLTNSTVTVHDLTPILYPYFASQEMRNFLINNLKLYSKMPVIMAISNTTKQALIDYGFDGKIMTIYNPVNKNFFPMNIGKEILRKQLGLPLDKKLVLSVSSTAPVKNLQILKPLMDNLGKNFNLVRVGVPIANSITCHNITEQTLNKLYNACDVLIMPSYYEGFGMPVLEAFSAGLPVVASNIPIFREICDNSAILAEINIWDFLVSIRDIINFNDEFKNKGLERAKFFSNEKFKKQIIDFYSEVQNS